MVGGEAANEKEVIVAEIIFKRASVRKFADKPVEDAKIEALLRAGMAAPSAGNQQPWEFFVVRNADVRSKLGEASRFAGPAAAAPVVIAVCSRTEGVRFEECVPQDMSAAIENILLEAVEQDLGAVWLGIAPLEDRMSAVAAAIDAPDTVAPFALIALGYAADEVVARGAERYDADRVHFVD